MSCRYQPQQILAVNYFCMCEPCYMLIKCVLCKKKKLRNQPQKMLAVGVAYVEFEPCQEINNRLAVGVICFTFESCIKVK